MDLGRERECYFSSYVFMYYFSVILYYTRNYVTVEKLETTDRGGGKLSPSQAHFFFP